jgi:glucose/arabinose dehydrogenase
MREVVRFACRRGFASPSVRGLRGGLVGLLGGLLVLALGMLAISGCGSASTGHASTASTRQGLVPIGAGLYGPAGLKAAVYAKGPPTVAAFAFDSSGRLWLTAAGLETHRQDGVYLVAKAGEAAQKIVSGLNDPLGLDWYAGKLYVASVGRVDAYWGFDGSRFTEHRTILKGPETGGENNLLTMAPNGRFVMGVSATCDHCTPTSKWDGAIVSFKPDGSDLSLYAGHVRAPFGLAYYPGTDELFVSMDQRDDLGAATPGDWLAIVHEGQDWGFPNCYGQGGPSCAGIPTALAALDPHGAVGGVAVLTGQLGPKVGNSVLVAEWNVAKIQRVGLERAGTGFRRTGVTPFLRGLHNPLALAIAPDGSLLAGDWATGIVYAIAANSSAAA